MSKDTQTVTATACNHTQGSVVDMLKKENDTTVYLEFPSTGGQLVELIGDNFGPLGSNNTVGVELTNEELDMGSPSVALSAFTPETASSKDDTFESLLGARIELVNCRVVVAHVRTVCEIPSGVGFNHTWNIVVGSQLSNSAPNGFMSSYSPPSVTALVLKSTVNVASALDTLGGVDIVELTGTNFGPIGTANSVHAMSLSVKCGDQCASAFYRDHKSSRSFPFEAFENRTSSTDDVEAVYSGSTDKLAQYNFKAVSCNVTVANTRMECVVGAGVGREHVWMVVVGGQVSDYLLNGQNTSYAPPVLAKLHPVTGPSFPLDVKQESADTYHTTITLHGTHFGKGGLGVAKVLFSVRAETFNEDVITFPLQPFTATFKDIDGNDCSDDDDAVNQCEYDRETLTVTVDSQNQEDGVLVFDAPALEEARYILWNPREYQDAFITVMVGGELMETKVDPLFFRYYTVFNMDPASTAKSGDASCLTVDHFNIYGHGFLTSADYFAVDTRRNASYAATDINATGMAGQVIVILGPEDKGNKQKSYFTDG